MDIPFNRWRHDLRSAITTMANTVAVIESGQISDPEVMEVTIASLKKAQEKLDQQYLEVYTLQRQSKSE